MKKITVSQIMKWHPCDRYPKERVRELIGRGKTLLEILDLKIPSKDRVWAIQLYFGQGRDWVSICNNATWTQNSTDRQIRQSIIKSARQLLKEKAS